MARKTKYNKIVSDDKFDLINTQNMNLLKEWEVYLKMSGRSSDTIDKYKSNVRIYFVWLLDNRENRFFVDCKKKDFMFFFDYAINEYGWSPNRTRVLKDTLSSFSNYIENMCDEDYPAFKNIVRGLEVPQKRKVREDTVLEEKEVNQLFDILIENSEYQMACLLALGLYGGARKQELTRYKLSYFDKDNILYGSLYRTPEPIKTKGRGGGKYIVKYTLKKEFERYLYLWKRERKKMGIGEFEWLFVTKGEKGYKQINVGTLDYYAQKMTKYLKNNGINKDFYWHCCRHFFTTSLKKANFPEDIITEIVGWESSEMVAIYNDLKKDDKLGKYFNENGIIVQKEKGLGDL